MKYSFTSVLLLLIFAAAGCGSANDPKSATGGVSGNSRPEQDTLVRSFPVDYMATVASMGESGSAPAGSYQDLLDLFDSLNYTPEAWEAGIRVVPRVYLIRVGDRWGSVTTTEIDVLIKKRIFFRAMAPMILQSNEWILMDRQRLESIRSKIVSGEAVTDSDQRWIMKLAGLYKAGDGKGMSQTLPDESLIDELMKKVDIIPPSLALAQGAEESGWGASRFAAEGNAIYGQWTWGKDALIPEQQRKELGNYGIAAFQSLQESVSAYMLNLNTHPAYAGLREKRASLRDRGEKITGLALAGQLTRYSERGEDYVRSLKSMIGYNRLEPADDAYLSDDPPMYLFPATGPAE